MRLIIVGAETLGIALTDIASKAGHDLVVIEPDAERAAQCADQYDVTVLNIGIAEEQVSEESDLARADAIIAATQDDSMNLMAMLLAREHGVEKRACVVNHGSHRRMFERLGVNVMIDPELLVAQHLLDLVLLPRSVDVTTLPDREQVMEVTLDARSPLAGNTLSAVRSGNMLGKDLVIILMEREDERFFPEDDTTLRSGDGLVVFSRRPIGREDLDIFIGDD